jgi:hypothetical protein
MCCSFNKSRAKENTVISNKIGRILCGAICTLYTQQNHLETTMLVVLTGSRRMECVEE